MIPLNYQTVISSFLSCRDYHLLSLVVTMLHTIRDVRLESIAEVLPLPIQFESRRKKMQPFLDLGALASQNLWLSFIKTFLIAQIPASQTVYVAIDRTGWGLVNLLMVSLIWNHRAIPLCWVRLGKLGSSHYHEQIALLSQALSILSGYTVVTLGDREFCSVDLARWLGAQGGYFCLLLKGSTQIQVRDAEWQ